VVVLIERYLKRQLRAYRFDPNVPFPLPSAIVETSSTLSAYQSCPITSKGDYSEFEGYDGMQAVLMISTFTGPLPQAPRRDSLERQEMTASLHPENERTQETTQSVLQILKGVKVPYNDSCRLDEEEGGEIEVSEACQTCPIHERHRLTPRVVRAQCQQSQSSAQCRLLHLRFCTPAVVV